MSDLKRSGVLVVALLTLVACGSDGDEAASPTAPETPTIPATTDTETMTETQPTGTTTDTESAPPAPVTVTITVRGGAPVGGIARPTVSRGDRVVLVITSDVSDEVHVHGYDVARDVAANGRARIALSADIPGRFEVELEERGIQIAEITVRP